ncbi:MAG: hypothetical protein LBP59_04305 [Planctomycetaceae bacterium]|nr:hypothetical protein [Planctomycetaceae bacterium]
MLSLAGQIFIVTKIVPIHTTPYPLKIFCLNFREGFKKLLNCNNGVFRRFFVQ